MMIITRRNPRSNVYHDEVDECKTAFKLIASENFITLNRKGQGKRTNCDRCQNCKARRKKAAKK